MHIITQQNMYVPPELYAEIIARMKTNFVLGDVMERLRNEKENRKWGK
jgi:hypothetical protein